MKRCNFYKISTRTTTTSQKIQNKFRLSFDHQSEYFYSLIFIAKFCGFAGLIGVKYPLPLPLLKGSFTKPECEIA